MATDHVYGEQDYFYRCLTELSKVRRRIVLIWARDQESSGQNTRSRVALACCALRVSLEFAHFACSFVSCRS